MADPTDLLTSGFIEASKQFTLYIGLGMSASISALVLDRKLSPAYEAAARVLKGQSKPEDEPALAELDDSHSVKVAGVSDAVPMTTARWILMGLTFVAGVLAANAVQAMNKASIALVDKAQIVAALCTYPSIATGEVALRYGAAVLPGLLLAIVKWRDGQRVRTLQPKELSAPYFMAYVAAMPYIVVIMGLHRLPC